ncbi:MAG TPA: hypothetical protein VID30_07020, partial [Bradyrhizobium sp.]
MIDGIPMSVQPKGDPDAMALPAIQTPKAAIPAEINKESALSICVPFQGLARQESGRQLKWPHFNAPFFTMVYAPRSSG